MSVDRTELRRQIDRAEASKDEVGWTPLMFTAELVTVLLDRLDTYQEALTKITTGEIPTTHGGGLHAARSLARAALDTEQP